MFVIILALLGTIRIQIFFVELTRGMMAENEVMEMAGAGVSDVQDDFRSAKYKGVLRYSEDNLIKDLFGKRESIHIFAVIYHQIKKRLKFIHLWRKELC